MSYSYRGLINLDPTYVSTPGTRQSAMLQVGDLNGDGYVDLLVLGTDFPLNGSAMPPNPVRPGRVFLNDGLGGFSPAPASLFPVDELLTVHPRKVLWADFNGDGRSDVFVADHGWDGPPFPGQQNLLFLSTPEGGWRSATATLPQVSDFSHTAAAADIDRDGDIDIFVGNGYNNTGASATAPYLLINDGQGRFTRNDADVPVAPGQALYMFPAGGGAVHFAGAAFSDLDHDGWADLVVTAEAAGGFDKFRQTTIFWNQGGRFDSTNVTRLAEPDGLPSHTDLDANFADFDGDGLLDIVLIGTNGNPSYDGGYVQVFRGLGQRQFLDVSAQVLPADGDVGAVDGVRTGKPWPMWVRVGDFNGDMGPDFWVEYAGGQIRQDTPIVWINDGKGGFSVIKAAFFVEPGQEWQFGRGLLVQSSTGFQNYTVQSYPNSGGLLLTGRATSEPYFGRPDDAGAEVLVGTAGTNWFVGGRGNDVIDGGAGVDAASYFGKASGYLIVPDPTGAGELGFTVIDLDPADRDEGADKVSSIERLRFADKDIELATITLPENLASIPVAHGSGEVTVIVVANSVDGQPDPDPAGLAALSDLEQSAAPPNLPSSLRLPIGLVSFEATVSAVGKTESFSLLVDDVVPVDGYWKQDAEGQWVNLASSVVHSGGMTRVDFTITDGGEFDADGLANGVIVDPGGLGWADRPALELRDKVLALYIAYFNRAPDAQGLQFWLDAAQNGLSLYDISAGFANHPRFAQEYGGLTNAQIAEKIYLNVLHRPGDADGIVFWTNQLNSRPASQIFVDFAIGALEVDLEGMYARSELTADEYRVAFERQKISENLMQVARHFLDLFGDATTPSLPGDQVYNDPAYQASIAVLKNVDSDLNLVFDQRDELVPLVGLPDAMEQVVTLLG